MHRIIASTTLFLFFSSAVSAQLPITVAELTVEVGANSEENLYYGFETGDLLIVSLELLDGKDLKFFEIIEYPENSRILEYETGGFDDKRLKVYQRGVFQFRLQNASLLKKRVCRLHIKRLPASAATVNFNPGVRWEERVDTTFNVQSETLHSGTEVKDVQQRRRVLAGIDTSVVTLLDKVERVHSRTNLTADNETLLEFELPRNRHEPSPEEPAHATEVVSWAYWIGTGEQSREWYQKANESALERLARGLTKGAISTGLLSGGYGALALLAIEGISVFSNPPSGENVQYALLLEENGEYKELGKGNSITGYGRVDNPNQGRFALRLANDNYLEGINVNVKVVAVTVSRTYRDEYFTETREVPVSQSTVVREPVLKRIRFPVLV
ncbi:MAG: hypothetical protein H6558_20350, partial [Lewinellaceae bacterium]|nr:hypothetical protein [Lewinellaceae bacterium]